MSRNSRPDRGEAPLGDPAPAEHGDDPSPAEHPDVADFVVPAPRSVPDPLDDLDFTEPEGSVDLGILDPQMPGDIDDLEDFATEDHVPVLPWTLTADVIETGTSLTAILDPTSADTILEGSSSLPSRFTLRLRMVVATVEPRRVPGDVVRIRVGRDVLAGRALILVE